MKPVQCQGGIGTVLLDGADVGLAHVATSLGNGLALVLGKNLFEKAVDGFPAFARSHPENAAPFQVVHHGGILVPLPVGDFVDADFAKPSDPMAGTTPGDDPMEKTGKRGGGQMQLLSRRLLGRGLAMIDK